MSDSDFLVEESAKNYKEFKKKRKFISGYTTAVMIGCGISLGATLPLFINALAITGLFSLTTGLIGGASLLKSCLIGGAVGAAVGGVASFIKEQFFGYNVIRRENEALRSIAKAKQTKYLEQIANKNQISVCSPQELDGRSSEKERLLK